MHDDEGGNLLRERLARLESRVPVREPAGQLIAGRQSSAVRASLIGVGALGAVAAVLLLVVLLRGQTEDAFGDASQSPIPSASAAASAPPSGSAAASAPPSGPAAATEPPGPTPTPQPTASPPDPAVDLQWSETASFGDPGTPSVVNDIVRSDAGLVAIGTRYDSPLPILGPTPAHEGLIWLSTDGVTWSDVTPDSGFADAELNHVLIADDSRLIAHGWVATDESGGRRPAAWESVGARRWDEIATGFPGEAWPMAMAQGARGHLALLVEPATPTLALWWSGEGRSWERVHDLGAEGGYAVGAGDEGFVVVGYRGSDQEPRALASADGREWFEAGAPPGVAVVVAPRGGDWIAVSRDPQIIIGEPSTARVWSSANGLEWTEIGSYPLEAIAANGAACTEVPSSLFAAGPWLVSGTSVSYGCSEGGVQTRGTQLVSLDGIAWVPLPFAPPSEEIGLGTRISGAIEGDRRLVLVGEADRVATFWIGEQP